MFEGDDRNKDKSFIATLLANPSMIFCAVFKQFLPLQKLFINPNCDLRCQCETISTKEILQALSNIQGWKRLKNLQAYDAMYIVKMIKGTFQAS